MASQSRTLFIYFVYILVFILSDSLSRYSTFPFLVKPYPLELLQEEKRKDNKHRNALMDQINVQDLIQASASQDPLGVHSSNIVVHLLLQRALLGGMK